MPRIARLKVKGEVAVYHVISRNSPVPFSIAYGAMMVRYPKFKYQRLAL